MLLHILFDREIPLTYIVLPFTFQLRPYIEPLSRPPPHPSFTPLSASSESAVRFWFQPEAI